MTEQLNNKKENELANRQKIWRKLSCILLSERSQSEETTYRMIPTIWHFGKGKTMETRKRSVVARGAGGTNRQAHRIFRVMKILCMIL